MCSDERMKLLLGDVTSELQRLDRDPSSLESWLGSHARSGSRLVGVSDQAQAVGGARTCDEPCWARGAASDFHFGAGVARRGSCPTAPDLGGKGHYYESLLHFAFQELAKLSVPLYSEPIPKEARHEPSDPTVRQFKPPLKSAKDVDFFCNVRRASFLEGLLAEERLYRLIRCLLF